MTNNYKPTITEPIKRSYCVIPIILCRLNRAGRHFFLGASIFLNQQDREKRVVKNGGLDKVWERGKETLSGRE